jgi:hypothetical protein
MKSFILAVAAATAVVVPATTFAQQSTTVTRAQVVAEQAELQRAGYYPRDWIHYPDNVQAAERKVAEQRKATAKVAE